MFCINYLSFILFTKIGGDIARESKHRELQQTVVIFSKHSHWATRNPLNIKPTSLRVCLWGGLLENAIHKCFYRKNRSPHADVASVNIWNISSFTGSFSLVARSRPLHCALCVCSCLVVVALFYFLFSTPILRFQNSPYLLSVLASWRDWTHGPIIMAYFFSYVLQIKGSSPRALAGYRAWPRSNTLTVDALVQSDRR